MEAEYGNMIFTASGTDFSAFILSAERMRRMPESKRTAALLAFMALEGLFYTTKFGLNPLDGEEKRRIFGEIAAAFPGIRRDEGEEKGAS